MWRHGIDPDLPEHWTIRVLAALDSLGYLAEGHAFVGPDRIEVTGDSGDERASDEIARLMAERLGEDALYDLDVTYREELDPTAALPTPAECVARIKAAAAEQKITFAPGSAELEPSARGTLDQIAAILRECGAIRMEIAGYTDSQGREEMNLSLSRCARPIRADGADGAACPDPSLVVRRYGEADPIADNDTEEGREANRRIEFRLIEEAAAPDGLRRSGQRRRRGGRCRRVSGRR